MKIYKIMLNKRQVLKVIDKIDEDIAEVILKQIDIQETYKEKGNQDYFKLYYIAHKDEYKNRNRKNKEKLKNGTIKISNSKRNRKAEKDI